MTPDKFFLAEISATGSQQKRCSKQLFKKKLKSLQVHLKSPEWMFYWEVSENFEELFLRSFQFSQCHCYSQEIQARFLELQF